MFETRVFVRNSCLIQPKAEREVLAGLAAIFLPVLIEKLLGTAASALKKAGDDETLRASGRFPTYLYQLPNSGNSSELKLHPEFRSIIVVRGSFDKETTGKAPPIDQSESVAKLRAGGILVRELALVYEAEIEIADDGTALRYESRYFEVSRFIEDGKKKSKNDDNRAVVLSLTITGVGEKEGEPILSLATINLGELNGGAILKAEDLISRQSSWLGGLAISEASLKAIENIKVTPGKPVNVMPITVEVTIAETKSGNAALKFIGEILDATKSKVAETVSGEVLDQGKKAAEAASALEQLLKEEETAFKAVLDAELEFAKLTPSSPPTEADIKELTVKKFAIETATRAWCLKFRALKLLGKAPTRPDHTCAENQP